MKPKLVLTIAAIYLGLVGLGLLVAPTFMVLDLPDEASPLLVSQLRAMSDVFIGVAVIDWAARNAEASRALNAIFLGNIAGFGLSVLLGLGVSLTGGQVVSWVFTALSLVCAVGFIVVGRANMSAAT
jgi:uncharacterized membrane-anchored protein YitT (DUF2179 family)